MGDTPKDEVDVSGPADNDSVSEGQSNPGDGGPTPDLEKKTNLTPNEESGLHDWDDEAACAVLRRCAEAAGRTGSVFVVEKTGAHGESPRTEMDLRMLAYFGGRERGVAELTSLGSKAGLHVVAVRRPD